MKMKGTMTPNLEASKNFAKLMRKLEAEKKKAKDSKRGQKK